jgi:hypothetical protein
MSSSGPRSLPVPEPKVLARTVCRLTKNNVDAIIDPSMGFYRMISSHFFKSNDAELRGFF